LHAPTDKIRIWSNEEGIGSIAYEGREGGIDLVAIPRVQNLDSQPDCVSSRLDIFRGPLGNGNIGRIYEHANASGFWQ
jgi:hypothetical protein